MSDDIKAIATRLVEGGDDRWDAADYVESVQREEDMTTAGKWILERLANNRPDDAVRYESELRRLSEFVQTRHPIGSVKHIGLVEAVPAAMQLISEASEWIGRQVKPDDAEPITAEWWREVFSSSQEGYGIYGVYVDYYGGTESGVELSVIGHESSGSTHLSHIRTRGDLRRLWVALTGKELGS